MQMYIFYFRILLILAFALGALGCAGGDAGRFEQQAEIMGTTFTVKIEGPGDHRRTAESAFEEIRRIDRLLSTYKPESEISEVNRRASSEPVKVGPDFLNVLSASRVYYELSGGAFDPSVKPLMDLWRDSKKEGRLPSEDALRQAAALVDLSKVRVDESAGTVSFIQQGMGLDFGAIAKGYAVDRAIEILKSHGVSRAIVDAGGNFYALGTPENKPQWDAGVRHPLRSEEVIIRFPISDRAVATSGSYERFFEIGGKKYSHIINPRAGRPVEGMLNATIIAEDAMTADGLSTAVFVLGPEEGMRLLERLPNVEGVLIAPESDSLQNFEISVSSGLKDTIELLFPARK
jgi:thiamine biosynthesis lipoprotein